MYEINYTVKELTGLSNIYFKCNNLEHLILVLEALIQVENCHAITFYKLPS